MSTEGQVLGQALRASLESAEVSAKLSMEQTFVPMPNKDLARKSFPGDIEDHVLRIQHDEGLYRHLYCGTPGTSMYHFSIVTWPGYLAVSGDMGEWIFTRTEDMLEFFRGQRAGSDLRYWAEKAKAGDTRVYSEDVLKADLLSQAEQWSEWRGPEHLEPLQEAIKDELFYALSDGISAAYPAISAFGWTAPDGETFDFETTELSYEEFDYHFVWICYGIEWAIKAYDAQKAEGEPDE